ncbi:MAG: hypothetical protein JKY61_11180 [Planctomycetes bacterium]|nr:hypothetical protein [Planctomycetota bacterium]
MLESAARGAAKKELRKLGYLRFVVMFGLFTSCIELIGDVWMLTVSPAKLLVAVFFAIDIVVVWFLWSTHKALATIYGRPRPFVIVLACLYTLSALGAEYQIEQVISGLYAILYWLFVGTLGKIEAIKAETPGAFSDPEFVRSVGAEETMHRRRVSGEPRKRKDTGAAKDRNRLLLILGGIGVALLVIAMGYKAMNKPPLPDQVIAEFRTEWNAGDFEGVAALAAVDRQSTWVKRLVRRDKKREWNGKPPTLELGVIEGEAPSAIRVNYPTGDGFLVAKFALSGKKWILKSLDYRGLP